MAPHTPDTWNAKKAFQYKSLVAAEALWAQVAEISKISPGYARTGRLQPLLTDRAVALAEARVADAAQNWGSDFAWEIADAPDPQWAPASPTGQYLHDTLTARIHPAQACTSLAGAIVRLGGEIQSDAPEEGPVIHATGWQGLLSLSETFEKPVGNGVKGQAVLLDFNAPPGAPQIFVDGLHIVPHADAIVAIGSTSERDFDDPSGTDAAIDALITRAVQHLPTLRDAPARARWAGVRPRAQSRAPLLGAWPGRRGHFIANGGFKIGFGIAWGVADVMADLVLDDRDRIPDAFAPASVGLA